jgi:3-methyladenine DNA glycosylase AlkD
MKPSEYCKEVGLSSLKEMSDISEVSKETLLTWWKTKPSLFKCVAHGCATDKRKEQLKLKLEVIRNEINTIIKTVDKQKQ